MVHKRKWNEHEYNVQDRNCMIDTTVKISCVTTQFPAFLFFGPHVKPHVVSSLIKHYHIHLYSKPGHIKYSTLRITCAYVACTKILDKPWDTDLDHIKQPIYQTVVDLTYWPMLGTLKAGTLLNLQVKLNQVVNLMIFISLFLMASATIWHHWCRLVNMVLSIQKIPQKWDITF